MLTSHFCIVKGRTHCKRMKEAGELGASRGCSCCAVACFLAIALWTCAVSLSRNILTCWSKSHTLPKVPSNIRYELILPRLCMASSFEIDASGCSWQMIDVMVEHSLRSPPGAIGLTVHRQ